MMLTRRPQFTIKYDSPAGRLTLASDGDNLTGLWFEGQKYFGNGLSKEAMEQAVPVLDLARTWLDQYFSGQEPLVIVPLDPTGTPFQLKVWSRISSIPYGMVSTYGCLAKSIPNKNGRGLASPRSVGGATGKNPISILIPCHRVVGASDTLVGYAAGLKVKEFLLSLEQEGSKTKPKRFFIPEPESAVALAPSK